MEILAEVAELMIRGLTFEDKSFSDAKTRIWFRWEGVERSIVYDRLSLRFYSHDLPDVAYARLQQELNARYGPLPAKIRKTHNEYKILFPYLSYIHPENLARVVKRESPDFALVLHSWDALGVEITELIDESRARILGSAPLDFGAGRRLCAPAEPGRDEIPYFAEKLWEKRRKVEGYEDKSRFREIAVACLCDDGMHFIEVADYDRLECALMAYRTQNPIRFTLCSYGADGGLLWRDFWI